MSTEDEGNYRYYAGPVYSARTAPHIWDSEQTADGKRWITAEQAKLLRVIVARWIVAKRQARAHATGRFARALGQQADTTVIDRSIEELEIIYRQLGGEASQAACHRCGGMFPEDPIHPGYADVHACRAAAGLVSLQQFLLEHSRGGVTPWSVIKEATAELPEVYHRIRMTYDDWKMLIEETSR